MNTSDSSDKPQFTQDSSVDSSLNVSISENDPSGNFPGDGAGELVVVQPFSPESVPGAHPDAYDLMQTGVPRLVPKSPPVSNLFGQSAPIHLAGGPKPELLYSKDRNENTERVLSQIPDHYDRRRYRKSPLEAEQGTVVRPDPPEKPYTTRFFQPIFNAHFRDMFLSTLAVGTLPVVVLTYGGPAAYKMFHLGYPEAGGDSAFVFLLSSSVGGVCVSFWIAFVAIFLQNLFDETSNGSDRIEYQSEFSYLDGLFTAGRFFLVSFSSILPGYVVWFLIHLFILDWEGADLTYGNVFNPVSEPTLQENGLIAPGQMSMFFLTVCFISHWIFYPIVFLSSRETRETFVPFSSYTLDSIPKRFSLWFQFYLYSIPSNLILSAFVYSYYIFGFYHAELFFNGLQFVLFLLLMSLSTTVYFRLLGRLAWVIEDEVYKKQKQQRESEKRRFRAYVEK